MKYSGRWFSGFSLLVIGIFLAGCESTSTSTYKFDPLAKNNGASAPATPAAPAATPASVSGTLLHVGDALTVGFSDIPTPMTPISDTIKDDGSITLMLNQTFQASGKTIGALSAEIRDRYVPTYFKYLTVSIKTDTRFYSVGGDVRSPNRQAYTGYMTVLRAIDTAGGFTDFARKGKVKVTRANGETFTVDCYKALANPSKYDREIYPGDQIFVPRRIL